MSLCRLKKAINKIPLVLGLILANCGSSIQSSTKGSMTAAGAALGTAAMLGIGTAVGAGEGWVAEKEVNKGGDKSRIEAISDEIHQQKALQLKLLAQSQRKSSFMAYLTKEFTPEIEKARIAIFENGAELNLYLNEAFFFTKGKTLSEEGKVLLRKIYEEVSSIPQMLFVVEDSNDSRRNDSGQNIWSVASFFHQEMSLRSQQILVKSNGKLHNISRKVVTFPTSAYPARIILISPSE